MNISVVIPSVGRTEKLLRCIEQLYSVTDDFECVVVVEDEDKQTTDAMREAQKEYSGLVVVNNATRRGCVYCWNLGAQHASGDAFIPCADDVLFHAGWKDSALKALNGYGLVGLNNGSGRTHKYFDDFYLATRDYCVDYQGGVLCCPHYKYICTDKEACLVAQRNNKYIYAEDAVIEHMHWIFKKSELDDTYDLRTKDGGTRNDEKIYTARKNAGFPIDYKPWFGKVSA